MSPKETAYIVERLAIRFMTLVTDHERQLTEHRAAFGARTDADAQLITKLQNMVREQSNSAKDAGEMLGWTANESVIQAVERVVKERDALRAEVAALQARLRASITRGDFAQMEVAALKSQNPKQHPVKVGEWVESVLTDACDQRHPLYRIGTKGRVGRIVERPNHIWEYHVTIGGSNQVWWESSYCIPCDPPATHDTEAGKAVAESAAHSAEIDIGTRSRKVTT